MSTEHHRAFWRNLSLVLHRRHGDRVGLVRQRPGCQLVPCGLHGGEVADPQIQGERGAQQAQRQCHHGDATPPPSSSPPARDEDGCREPGEADPDPQRIRRGVIGQSLGRDVPVGRRGEGAADDERPRQPAQLPAPAATADGGDQGHRRDDLHGDREPSVHQGRWWRNESGNVTAISSPANLVGGCESAASEVWPAGTAASRGCCAR